MNRALIIFVRHPELGKVKTRLAKTIGDEAALRIYKQLLAHTRRVAEAVVAKRMLFYAETIVADDEWDTECFIKREQQGGDLGHRMRHAFESAFESGCDETVIIGSDCPGLTAPLVESAFQRLSDHDMVIGPAADGGYYLLGMRRVHDAVFINKRWSTASVFADTIRDVESLGLRLFQLPVLRDVDELSDLPAMEPLL